MPKFTPKLTPAPITAARATRDYHIKKGTWVAITDDGQIKIIGDDTFRLLYTSAPTEDKPKARRVHGPRHAGWHPDQQQAVILRALQQASAYNSGAEPRWVKTEHIKQWLPKDLDSSNISARLAGLISLNLAERRVETSKNVWYRITAEGIAKAETDREWLVSRHAA